MAKADTKAVKEEVIKMKTPTFKGGLENFEEYRSKANMWLKTAGTKLNFPGAELYMALGGEALETVKHLEDDEETYTKEGAKKIIQTLTERYRKIKDNEDFNKIKLFVEIKQEGKESYAE